MDNNNPMQQVPTVAGPAENTQAVPVVNRIGSERVREANAIFQEYKAGKKNLEDRIVKAEQWYKLRHWEYIRTDNNANDKKTQVEPVSGWLFNALANKHADAMDNYPEANILPREENDKPEAEKLTAIVPVVMEQCDYEQVYSDGWDSKLRGGTCVTGVFWNSQKLNGLGDIDIQEMDILNLFWEPGVTDIQKSRNFFSVELCDNELLEERYPELKGTLGGNASTVSEYVHEDQTKTVNKTLVVDWYYKLAVGKRTVLHYCKYVNETVLYASENDPQYAERGYYDHGLYPFVFDPLFKVKGSPCGFGYIDLAKSTQEYIDKCDQAMMKNLQANARPRYFSKNNGGINEEEFADQNKDIVHYEGSPEGLVPIRGAGLPGVYVNLHQNKIEELKETTGNRDVSTGGTASGVTAAAAIAAMQEAGSKMSRDANKAAYRAFRKVVLLVVELIRQFYTVPRSFRITGEAGAEKFEVYNSNGIQRQLTGKTPSGEDTFRMPLFDIKISAQKQSAYSKLSQNEMAIQFYSAGFFNPELADQAMACLEMMDFDRKSFVMNRIQQNGLMHQQLQKANMTIMQLCQIVDKLTGSNLTGTQGGSVPAGQPAPAPAQGGTAPALGTEAKESYTTKNARQRVADSTAPT